MVTQFSHQDAANRCKIWVVHIAIISDLSLLIKEAMYLFIFLMPSKIPVEAIVKEYRDRLMYDYHERWPHYGFDQHKGYGTAKHKEDIQKYELLPNSSNNL